ncbi:MAG: hypothetical protein AAF515_04465 [Pseudomonadota bacterium]
MSVAASYREEALYLGAGGPFAVYCRPDTPQVAPPLVMLNAGLVPHAGPYRLHVTLARRLAARGVASVRLDQAGKGESPRRPGSREALLKDDFARLQDRLAALDPQFSGQLQLFGLCSGADDALLVAEAFDSVTGLVLLDGYAPADIGFRARYIAARLASLDWWLTRGRRLFGRSSAEYTAGVEGPGLTLRDWRSATEMTALYRALLDRGVRMLALFSGDLAHDYYNGGRALSRSLGAAAGLTEIYRPDLNHLLPGAAQREVLWEQLESWLGLPVRRSTGSATIGISVEREATT